MTGITLWLVEPATGRVEATLREGVHVRRVTRHPSTAAWTCTCHRDGDCFHIAAIRDLVDVGDPAQPDVLIERLLEHVTDTAADLAATVAPLAAARRARIAEAMGKAWTRDGEGGGGTP